MRPDSWEKLVISDQQSVIGDKKIRTVPILLFGGKYE